MDIDSIVRDNSAIIMDKPEQKIAGALVRATTEEAVFPVFSDPIDEVELL